MKNLKQNAIKIAPMESIMVSADKKKLLSSSTLEICNNKFHKLLQYEHEW